MATHSSILTWRSLWTQEFGGLQSMESQSWTWLSDCHPFTSYQSKRKDRKSLMNWRMAPDLVKLHSSEIIQWFKLHKYQLVKKLSMCVYTSIWVSNQKRPKLLCFRKGFRAKFDNHRRKLSKAYVSEIWWLRSKESACQVRRWKFDPRVRKTP